MKKKLVVTEKNLSNDKITINNLRKLCGNQNLKVVTKSIVERPLYDSNTPLSVELFVWAALNNPQYGKYQQ